MKYISTRGQASPLNFLDTIIEGLASDGGLFFPEKLPKFSFKDIKNFKNLHYVEISKIILWPFVKGTIDRSIFNRIIDDSYSNFSHPEICPLKQIGDNEFILELFYGPTLAFKDIAMQFLSKLMNYVLHIQDKNITIIGATSGDTGGAAIEAFSQCQRSEIFILFPFGNISKMQQYQMTRRNFPNINVIGIHGTFDDCQKLAKSMFQNSMMRKRFSLVSINSINWARIMAQIVYYFSSAISLGSPNIEVTFSVPTGNFGNILAGFIAKKMGLPIKNLIISTNENDILVRALNSGIYKINNIIHTTSPSIDIQISSNFERLLFSITNHNSSFIQKTMNNLNSSGYFIIDEEYKKNINRIFLSGKCNVSETENTIKKIYQEKNYLLDPHTAVAFKVGSEYFSSKTPTIILATAHPSKFPETVQNACGKKPDIPKWSCSFTSKKESFDILPNNEENLREFILQNSRF